MIVFGQDTILALKDHFKRRLVESDLLGERWQANDLIFPSYIGTPLDQSNLNRQYKNLLR